jgi:hypothetical protein
MTNAISPLHISPAAANIQKLSLLAGAASDYFPFDENERAGTTEMCDRGRRKNKLYLTQSVVAEAIL